jgi:RimJ/RimL family protein N-acetyltransferase
MDRLSAVLERGQVRLEPLAAHHMEPLRQACAEDQEIWKIYPVNMLGSGFDEAMQAFHAMDSWVKFAAVDAPSDQVVGMTNYINPDQFGVVEIGGTYIAPKMRGTGFNRCMKKLLIEHAFDCGMHKIEFRVDTRNKRSMAAVLKLGAQSEGILRQNRVTWTGYRRDTAVFGLLENEWTG